MAYDLLSTPNRHSHRSVGHICTYGLSTNYGAYFTVHLLRDVPHNFVPQWAAAVSHRTQRATSSQGMIADALQRIMLLGCMRLGVLIRLNVFSAHNTLFYKELIAR